MNDKKLAPGLARKTEQQMIARLGPPCPHVNAEVAEDDDVVFVSCKDCNLHGQFGREEAIRLGWIDSRRL